MVSERPKKLISGVDFFLLNSLIALIVYTASDSFSVRVNLTQYISYGIFLISTLFCTFILMLEKGPKKIKNKFLLWFPALILLIPYSIIQNNLTLNYFMSDLSAILLIISVLICAERVAPKIEKYGIHRIVFYIFFASIIGVLIGDDFWNARYEPLHYILAVFLFSKLLVTKSIITSKYLVLLVLIVGFNFISGERSTVVLTMFLILSLSFSLKNKLSIFAFLSLSLTTIFYLINNIELGRFMLLASEQGDTSLLGRFYEVKDIVRHFDKNGSLYNYFFGFGYSATYQPFNFIGTNLNLDSFGNVHHAHFTPVLIYFRYGLIGFLFYAWLFYLAIKYYLLVLTSKTKNFLFIFSVTLLLIFLIDSLLRSVLIDPVFYFSLLLFIYVHQKFKENPEYIYSRRA